MSRNVLIDLRSDTVTRPCSGMRRAMSEAEVGDDVYGEDPTVIELEQYVANLLGKECGLFVTSGTQGNLVSLLSHCGRGDEYIGGVGYHISTYEAGGASVLGGISARHLPVDSDGAPTLSDIKSSIMPDDSHYAISRLVCLENTFGGRVVPQKNIEAISELAHPNGLLVHLDGARLMNASIESGVPASSLVSCVDSVSFCLSKGLGAPAGTVVCGTRDFIARARRIRKMVGGGMRQSGILAAAGLFALKNNVERLGDDHANAATLSSRLADIDGITVTSTATNMVWLSVDSTDSVDLSSRLLTDNILVSHSPPTLRLVCHLDFPSSAIDSVIDSFARHLS